MKGSAAVISLISLLVATAAAQSQHRGSGSGSGSGAGSTIGTAQSPRPRGDNTPTAFSDQQVADLKAGRGMGLAHAAELNGYPGPAHVLELSDLLKLTDQQKADVQVQFDWMTAQAEQVGRAYLDAEAALDEAFRSKTINPARLKDLLSTSEKIRAELRNVHLAAHLETTATLTEQQQTIYAAVRTYIRGQGSARRGSGSGAGATTETTGNAACSAGGGSCCCGAGGCGASSGMSCRPKAQ